MTVAAGLEVEPSGAQAAVGLKTVPQRAADSAGTASFQSGWQSLLASLGTELSTSAAQKQESGTMQSDVPGTTGEKSAQLPTPSDPIAEDSQISQPRVRPDAGALLQHEGAGAATTQQEVDFSKTEHMTKLGSSENSVKPAKHTIGAEKKPASQAPLTQQAAAFLAAAVPVQQPAALQPQYRASVSASNAAQSFLTETSFVAGHNSGMSLPLAAQKSEPTGILATTANGVANSAEADTKIAATATQDNTNAEARVLGNTDHAHSIDASLSGPVATQPVTEASAHAPVNIDAGFLNNAKATADGTSVASASAESAGAVNALSGSEKRASAPSDPRSIHGPADRTVSPLAGHIPSVQPIVAGDESASARDVSTAHGTINTGAAASAADKVSTPAAHETFAALDSGVSHGPAWLHAGAHSAEAGFEDPTLGWVSVRADMSGGGVHAAVVPGTAEAAQTLSTHMAGLNNYLSEHRTAVHTLSLATPGSGSGFNQAAGQGSGQHSGSYNEADQRGNPWTPIQSSQPLSSTSVQMSHVSADAATVAIRTGASISLIA
jgi:hypothetical protein